jgi:hypothetical protein
MIFFTPLSGTRLTANLLLGCNIVSIALSLLTAMVMPGGSKDAWQGGMTGQGRSDRGRGELDMQTNQQEANRQLVIHMILRLVFVCRCWSSISYCSWCRCFCWLRYVSVWCAVLAAQITLV